MYGPHRELEHQRREQPCAVLTGDTNTLVKSHNAAIKQLLEDFNDDQMMFHLEAEAYERERLTVI